MWTDGDADQLLAAVEEVAQFGDGDIDSEIPDAVDP
jgi:hypothetical protein